MRAPIALKALCQRVPCMPSPALRAIPSVVPAMKRSSALGKLARAAPALAAVALLLFAADTGAAEPRVSTFKLANGMEVVVIPDHRVPVVTHMVWYRVGAGEDPWGVSGIAHFLE